MAQITISSKKAGWKSYQVLTILMVVVSTVHLFTSTVPALQDIMDQIKSTEKANKDQTGKESASSRIISLDQIKGTEKAKKDQAGESASSQIFSVWMFPFPPPHSIKINDSETLLCAYANACSEVQDPSTPAKVNLRELTEGTYFHNYVRDHAYHKVRHMNDFPYHIQAITMLSLLKTSQPDTTTCVHTLGGKTNFCEYEQFSSYDPYESEDLNETNYPYPLLEGLEDEGGNTEFSLAPREILTTEKFAMWGWLDLPESEMVKGRYNSGEDVQSYAGASWLPFISEIRPKEEALLNYTGYYIGNALLGGKGYSSTQEDHASMHKISLLSIYGSGVVPMMDYIKSYTEIVDPFGCRSLLTCRELRKRKIKSYFSACLTLTIDMQGAVLDDQQNRHVLNAILKPDAKEILPPEKRTKIILVDVQDRKAVPESVLKSEDAIFLQADIKNYPGGEKKMGRYGYAYKLLSTYANQAKVVITSRIHVGLPAAAMGIPVIFIEDASGWLPGGRQKVGRVEGLLDVFHRVERVNGKNWTFGDLTGDVPPNAGNHLADRYRASFWHRLKKTHFYEDTARMFGMVPFKRLGRKNIQEGIQKTFHFVLNQRDLCWQTQRSIEHVFFYHPNAEVYIHTNDIRPSDLEIFSEIDYNLIVKKMDPELKGYEDASLPFALLQNYGGTFVSKNTLIRKEIPENIEEGVIVGEDGAPTMAFFLKDSQLAKQYLESEVKSKPSWSFSVLSDVNTTKCVQEVEWTLDGLEEMLAVSLNPLAYASINTIMRDAECFKIIEEPCIFCDELHWDY